MILYLVRHAVAMEREDWDGSDEARPLTEEGIEKMREACRALAKMGLKIDRVLTSPLTRARQTADILVKELGLPKPDLTDTLACGASPIRVMKELEGIPADASVALVGHEPDMGDFAAFFIGAARPMPFKKGAIMAIEMAGRAGQGNGHMLWYMPTKVMRHLKS